MKASTRFAVAVALTVGLLPTFAAGQGKGGSRTRGLMIKNFETGKTDGMRVLIYKVEGNLIAPVDPSRTFTRGDEIKVAFEANFDGYVYFVNVSPGGKSKVLFPFAGETDNAMRTHQRYELPRSGVIAFDEEKGTEVLQVVMSRDRIKVFDEAIKNSNGDLGTSAASAAAELAANGGRSKSGIVAENVAIVLPETAGIRTRGIKLAQGKDKDEKGTIVSIPDANGKSGKLQSGEVAVFEIRLKHV